MTLVLVDPTENVLVPREYSQENVDELAALTARHYTRLNLPSWALSSCIVAARLFVIIATGYNTNFVIRTLICLS
jgi:hypothetical protein